MKYDRSLILAHEIYELYCEIRTSWKKTDLKGAEYSQNLIKKELSDCTLAIWCAGYLGYKQINYRLILKSMDTCYRSVNSLHNIRKISISDHQSWDDAIQRIIENLKDIIADDDL